MRTRGVELRDELGRVEHVFEVVDHQQHSLVQQTAVERSGWALPAQWSKPERARERGGDVLGPTDSRKLHPTCTVRKGGFDRMADGLCEPGLADTARARESHQSRFSFTQEPTNRLNLCPSTDRWGGRKRQDSRRRLLATLFRAARQPRARRAPVMGEIPQ